MANESSVQMELAYSNGTVVTSDLLITPYFGDISLTRRAAEDCAILIKEGAKFNHPVRNDDEAKALAEYIKRLRNRIKELEDRVKTDINPWQRVIDQIKTATKGFLTGFKDLDEEGRERLANYAAQKKAGRLTAGERYKQKSEAKALEAQYSDNPKKQHRAELEAKAYAKEAKEVAKSPVLPGMDTEEYLKEVVIVDRTKAARMEEDAVSMNAAHAWFVKDIREKRRAGVKIWAHMYPGIELVFGTRIRLPRP